ncbi:MAG: hypothetical protein A2150_02615 [Candidatus Muproteobacteria bacterium RBG_16_64_11]|uniref:Uncharacterized protein n=1 Tax=Candidatus Muproteobacteria bacterium RBG_16_64_11 TaxID=1817758 RepID=A0A1F6TFD7_9PROT|nr:MAG: hypothetical protein A2150_02615 [Candidatus Muproteobacteria bacterium RBG_16_64_11]
MPALLGLSGAEVGIALGETRSECNRRAERLFRLREPPLIHEDVAQVEVGRGVVRLVTDRQAQIFFRLRPIPDLGVQQAEVVQRFRVIRAQPYGFLKGANGLLRFSLPVKGNAKVAPARRKIRPEPNALPVSGLGVGQPSSVREHVSQNDP